MRPEPVAILAAGVVTPIGGDLDAFWTGLLTGASGISTIERFPVGDLRVQRGGEIKKLPSGGESARGCRASRLLCAAADDLRARAPLAADRARIGVVVGTALGGVEALEDALGGDIVQPAALVFASVQSRRGLPRGRRGCVDLAPVGAVEAGR